MIIVNSYLKKKSFFWIRTAGSKSLRRYLTLSVLRNPDLNDPEFGNVFADCKLLIFYRLGYVLFSSSIYKLYDNRYICADIYLKVIDRHYHML